jgi:excisionase family DNA binding protein
MRHDRGKNFPTLICDYCGKPIEDWRMALVAFHFHEEDTVFSPVHVYHKGTCDQGEALSQELSSYLPWLLWNHRWGSKRRSGKGHTITIKVPEPRDISPELLTIPEAAEKMHVSRESIYAWIRENKIKPVKTPGGRYRIPEEQLIKPALKAKEEADA